MIEFSRIPKEYVEQAWPLCAPHLVKSFFRGVNIYGLNDLKVACITDQCQLWTAAIDGGVVAAAVTALESGSLGKTCCILNLGGDQLREWIAPLDEAVCAFAKENGCVAVEAVTRKGFSRFVPGFVEDGVVYVKIIGGDNGTEA